MALQYLKRPLEAANWLHLHPQMAFSVKIPNIYSSNRQGQSL